jgi:hypothetical protein
MILPAEKPSDWKGPKRKISMKGSTKYNTRGQRKRDWKDKKGENKGCQVNLTVKNSKRRQMRKQKKNRP